MRSWALRPVLHAPLTFLLITGQPELLPELDEVVVPLEVDELVVPLEVDELVVPLEVDELVVPRVDEVVRGIALVVPLEVDELVVPLESRAGGAAEVEDVVPLEVEELVCRSRSRSWWCRWK
jgi:hypothetical protein